MAALFQKQRLLPLRAGREEKQQDSPDICITLATWKTVIQDLLGTQLCISVNPNMNDIEAYFVDDDGHQRVLNVARELRDLYRRIPFKGPKEIAQEQWANNIINERLSYSMYEKRGVRVYMYPDAYDLFKSGLGLLCGAGQSWRAITIGTPGHISIALWNVPRKTMEIFDSSGIPRGDNMWPGIVEVLQKLVGKDVRIEIVNDQYLQQEDILCQTWIWYYVYMRIAKGERVGVLIRRLQAMSPMQRFQEISQFWNFLLQVQTPKSLLFAS
jgi:hypothetical protein